MAKTPRLMKVQMIARLIYSDGVVANIASELKSPNDEGFAPTSGDDARAAKLLETGGGHLVATFRQEGSQELHKQATAEPEARRQAYRDHAAKVSKQLGQMKEQPDGEEADTDILPGANGGG